MRYAIFLSAILHFGVLAAGFIVAPFLEVPEVQYRQVVPVELLSEAEFSERLSVPADRKSEEVVEEVPPPSNDIEVASLPEPIPTPQPVEPKPEPKPEPRREEPKPEPKPQPRREETKPKTREDDFFSGLDEALIDLEDDQERGAPAEVTDPEGLRDQDVVGLGDQLSASHIDQIRARMAERCYDQPTGVPDAEKLVVRIRFNLDRSGEIIGQPEVLNARQIALSNNSWWRATRDRALQAVVTCAPYDFLPQEQYYIWSEITLNFTPLGVM